MPARTAQELLGHPATTLTLDIYTCVLPDQKKAAADAIAAAFRK